MALLSLYLIPIFYFLFLVFRNLFQFLFATDNYIGDGGCEVLADILASLKYPSLISIDLRGNPLVESGVRKLAGAIQQGGILRRAELFAYSGDKLEIGADVVLSADYEAHDGKDGPLKPGDVGKLIKVDSSGLPYLVSFNGTEHRYRAGAIEPIVPKDPALLSALAALRGSLFANTLRALSSDSLGSTADLSRLDLVEASLSQLLPALQAATSVTCLDLRHNPSLGDGGLGALLSALAAFEGGPRLASVLLDGCKPSPWRLAQLKGVVENRGPIKAALDALKRGASGPSDTSLVGLGLSDAHAGPLSDALASNTALTFLDLKGNALGEAGLLRLAEAARLHGSLLRLEVDSALAGEKLEVGDEVSLSVDYASHGDAKGGPLKPGDVGKVVKADADEKRYKVSFNGKEWWYGAPALASILPKDPAHAKARSALFDSLYANCIAALSSDRIGPLANLSRLELTEASVPRLGPALLSARGAGPLADRG